MHTTFLPLVTFISFGQNYVNWSDSIGCSAFSCDSCELGLSCLSRRPHINIGTDKGYLMELDDRFCKVLNYRDSFAAANSNLTLGNTSNESVNLTGLNDMRNEFIQVIVFAYPFNSHIYYRYTAINILVLLEIQSGS